MARTIRPVAVTTTATAAVTVPDDVAADLSGIWEHIKEHPEYVAVAEFTDEDDNPGSAQAVEFIAQGKAWAVANHLVFRKLANKGLGENVVKFSIREPLTPEEVEAKKKAAAERKAAREAKKAAEATETPAEDTAETPEQVKPGPAKVPA